MRIEKKLVNYLINNKLTICTAESCTGGLLVGTLINIKGTSNVISESFVTYSNEAKIKLLNVKEDTLNKYTVYSKEVAVEMAEGLDKLSNAYIKVSVTGEAGGLTKSSGDGIFYYTIRINNTNYTYQDKVSGTRNHNRRKQVKIILNKVYSLLTNNKKEKE